MVMQTACLQTTQRGCGLRRKRSERLVVRTDRLAGAGPGPSSFGRRAEIGRVRY